MREEDRKPMRLRLDEEMKPFRAAGRRQNSTNGLLKAVRQALGIRLEEVAERSGMARSVVNDIELRELDGRVMLRSLGRMAEAMGCKVVYGVVPLNGKTLEGLAAERLWKKVLGAGNEKTETGDVGTR